MEHSCARRLPRATFENKSIGTRKLLGSYPGEEGNYFGLGPNGAKGVLWLDELAINVENWARSPREFDTAERHEAILPSPDNCSNPLGPLVCGRSRDRAKVVSGEQREWKTCQEVSAPGTPPPPRVSRGVFTS